MATNKQRREAERRRLQRQAERRRERAVRRRRINLIISIVGVIVVVGGVLALLVSTSGDDDTPAATAPSTTPTSPSPSASPTVAAYPCTWTPSQTQGAKAVDRPSTTKPAKTGTVTVSVRTNRGTIGFALDRAKAPCAVESFLSLVEQKYYNSTPCHRLTTGPTLFVLQCGDPSGTGSGGPGYSFADELTGKERYTTGVLAMANSGANTNGSQFFIVYKNSQLSPQYTVFGKVASGLDVVSKVAAGGVTPVTTGGATPSKTDGKPKLPITLSTLAVAK